MKKLGRSPHSWSRGSEGQSRSADQAAEPMVLLVHSTQRSEGLKVNSHGRQAVDQTIKKGPKGRQ